MSWLTRRRRKAQARRRQRRPFLLLGAAVLVGLGVWYLVIPYPWTLRSRDPQRTSLMEQRMREARRAGDSLEIRQDWVPLEEIAPGLARAVLVAEDHRFREHRGIDWASLAEEVRWSGGDRFSWTRASDLRALAEAVAYAWSHRDDIRGRSTITQQLAKNLYFGTDRSFLRKVMEAVVARRLERRLDKDRILELYLNVVEWGPGLFGAEAASRAYFGVPASALTLAQAAALAGTLPHPLTSNPATNPGRMRWRRALILDRLTGPPQAEPEPLPLPDIQLPDTGAVPSDTPGGLAGDSVLLDTLDRPVGDSVPPDTLDGPVTDSIPLDTLGAVPDTGTAGARFESAPEPTGPRPRSGPS